MALAQAQPTAHAAEAKSDPAERRLYDTVAELDRVVFDAYNSCDLKKIGEMWVEDLEFYHDQSGLEVSRASNLEVIRKNLCSENQNWRTRRELIEGSLEVYPLNGYGAVEMGSHRFYVVAAGKKDELTSVAKFVTVWQRQNDGGWKMSRILSYDHHAPQRGDEAPVPGEMYENLAKMMDRALFDAFNAGNADQFKTFLTEDAEFYHDQGGLTRSRQSIVESLERKFRSDKANGETMRRELVEGSVKVYPLERYGAIQIGTHRFYQTANGGKSGPRTIAKFIHVWKNTGGRWEISRILSYDHKQEK
jgi:ketosteroid isomerase-like protein